MKANDADISEGSQLELATGVLNAGEPNEKRRSA